MTEWGVVAVIIALAGLIVTICTPIVKLNSSITKLITKMDDISDDLSSLTSANTTAHRRLWDRSDQHDARLADHETRLCVLEHDKKEK